MKFGLIIQDLSADEVQDILANLDGETITVTSTSGNESEFDSAGQPWDERIHAGTRRKTKNGTWQKKKGVDDATIASVEANRGGGTIADKFARVEQSMGVVGPAIYPASAPMPPIGQVGVVAPYAAAPPAPAPVAPPAPHAVAAPVAPPAPPSRDFQGLMQQISKLFATQQITPDYPTSIVARVNQGFNVSSVSTLTDIANNPQMINYAWQCLDIDGKAA